MTYDKVILGCGELQYEGNCLYIDQIQTRPDVFVWNLNEVPWPTKDETTETVVAKDVIEHLDDVIKTIEECHRILRPEGELIITTPHYESENSWHDPTHKWHLTERSFDYFDPGTEFGSKYGYYTKAKFEILRNEFVGDGNIYIEMKAIK